MSEYRTEAATLDASEISRRESMGSRSLSDWNCSDTIRSDERISPGTCSVSANTMFKVSACYLINFLHENEKETSDGLLFRARYRVGVKVSKRISFFT